MYWSASSAVVVGPSLMPIGFADLRRELDVRVVQLPGALPDPHHVRGDVVQAAGAGVDAGEGRLVVEEQRLVGGVELDGLELLRVGPAGVHEVERLVDLAGQLLVALAGRGRLDEVLVPGVDLAQVGVTAGGEGADQVQRGGGRVVHPLQALGVRDAGGLVEVEAVDRVTAVRRQGHAVAGLGVLGAGLGVLARDPAHLHDRHGSGVGEDGAHLEERLQLVADLVGRHRVEGLGAVAALEEERLSLGDSRQPGAQLIALAREDERRIRLEVRDHCAQSLGVGVLGLLRRGQVSPGVASARAGLSVHGHASHITGSCRVIFVRLDR
ncbi:hypothetical protein RKD18_002645 [Streptomyces phaeoluteigriseus]